MRRRGAACALLLACAHLQYTHTIPPSSILPRALFLPVVVVVVVVVVIVAAGAAGAAQLMAACRDTKEKARAIREGLFTGCLKNLSDAAAADAVQTAVPASGSLSQVGSIDAALDLEGGRAKWALKVLKRVRELQEKAQQLAEKASQELRKVTEEQMAHKGRMVEVAKMLELANGCIRNAAIEDV